jgi:hypothetical protein
MQDLNAAFLALKAIILHHRPYQEALARTFAHEKLANSDKASLKRLLHYTLSHYQTLTFESLDLFADYRPNSDETFLNVLSLAGIRSDKDFSKSFAKAYQETFKALSCAGDPLRNSKMLLKSASKPYVIPDKAKEIPLLFNSLVLETPEFYLKELSEEYSPEKAAKILLSLHAHPTFFLAADPRKGKEDAFKDDPRFLATAFQNGSYLYQVRDNRVLASLPEIKDNVLYPIDALLAQALSEIVLPKVTPKILITSAKYPSSGIALSAKTASRYGSLVLSSIEDPLSYRLAMDAMTRYGLASYTPSPVKTELLKTYYDYDSFDFVLNEAQDTEIGRARKDPGLLPSLTEKLIQASAKRLLNDLLESSEFVKKDGDLLFVSHSLLKNETSEIPARFLALRKNFRLLKEVRILPDEMNRDGGYYALLRRA